MRSISHIRYPHQTLSRHPIASPGTRVSVGRHFFSCHEHKLESAKSSSVSCLAQPRARVALGGAGCHSLIRPQALHYVHTRSLTYTLTHTHANTHTQERVIEVPNQPPNIQTRVYKRGNYSHFLAFLTPPPFYFFTGAGNVYCAVEHSCWCCNKDLYLCDS